MAPSLMRAAQYTAPVDLMHAPTGTTLFVAAYWVPHAAVTAFVVAGVLIAPYYLVPFVRGWLLRHRRST